MSRPLIYLLWWCRPVVIQHSMAGSSSSLKALRRRRLRALNQPLDSSSSTNDTLELPEVNVGNTTYSVRPSPPDGPAISHGPADDEGADRVEPQAPAGGPIVNHSSFTIRESYILCHLNYSASNYSCVRAYINTLSLLCIDIHTMWNWMTDECEGFLLSWWSPRQCEKGKFRCSYPKILSYISCTN